MDGTLTDEVQAVTEGTLRDASGQALPLLRTAVRAAVSGPLARVTVEQAFQNVRDVAIECVYLFPLPREASVHRMEFRIGGRVVRGVVKSKSDAREAYRKAKLEGRAATLLEEDAPAVFTLSVANVPPGETVDVSFAYEELVAYDDGRWNFVFPMVAPETYREAANNDREVNFRGIDPPRIPTGERSADVSVSVTFTEEPEGLCCGSHRTVTERSGTGVTVSTAPGALANRDFSLSWTAGAAGVRPDVRFERVKGDPGAFLLTLTPSVGVGVLKPMADPGGLEALRCGNCGALVTDLSAVLDIPGLGPVVRCTYCCAVLTPGTKVHTRAARPRDVLVLIDRSASMRGSHPTVVKSVMALLRALSPGDAIQLVGFDHDHSFFDAEETRFVAVSPEVLTRAEDFVSGLTPRGGTELERALALSAKLQKRSDRTRITVLITDAAVGNEGRLLRCLPELLGDGVLLFVLGVGSAVGRGLVRRLAQVGGGASDVLSTGDDTAEILTRFARRVREGGPVLTGLTLHCEGAEFSELHPRALPDLYGGQVVQVVGRFIGTGPATVVITGATVDGRGFRQEVTVTLPEESDGTPGLVRCWARREVTRLAECVSRGGPDAEARTKAGTSLSLRYSIVGPFASLVAEDSAVSVERVKRRRAKLIVIDRDKREHIQAYLEKPSVTLGSSAGCDVVINDHSLDDAHVLFSVDGRGWAIQDLSSTVGTKVNGRSVRHALLAPGAVITIDGRTLRFELCDEPNAYFEVLPTERVEAPIAQAMVDDALEVSEARPTLAAPPPPAMRSFATERSTGAPSPGSGMAADVALSDGECEDEDEDEDEDEAPRGGGGIGRFFAEMVSLPLFIAKEKRVSHEVRSAPVPMFAPLPAPPPAAPPALSPAPSAESSAGSPAGSRERARAARGPAQAQQSQTKKPLGALGGEPYPESELAYMNTRGRGELDLVFLVDATGSMGPYIDTVQRQMQALIDALKSAPLCRSLRLGLVSYRDHPPQDDSYVTQMTDLTDKHDAILRGVEQLSASGGGDGPEAVTDGLFDLVRLGWRPEAAKAVVWFGDAPPHGVEPSGDGFHDGCPCGRHWYTQAESCREMGITVYAIGCLPGLRSFVGAEDVFRQVARASRGMFLPLREAGLLVSLIAGAAVSELDRQRIDEHVYDMAHEWQASLRATNESERVKWLTETLTHKGVRPRGMQPDEQSSGEAEQSFRELTLADVSGALSRLRLTGRLEM